MERQPIPPGFFADGYSSHSVVVVGGLSGAAPTKGDSVSPTFSPPPRGRIKTCRRSRQKVSCPMRPGAPRLSICHSGQARGMPSASVVGAKSSPSCYLHVGSMATSTATAAIISCGNVAHRSTFGVIRLDLHAHRRRA